ncbi:methyl-accepting chemotaxis protein [Paraburkholderia sp. J41]|uniref:methyl-accepting chemotaxis protein n=1 Tax=Paraburkholderia sp. J41 TaxID=2805433 RepID=UPI002AC35737|nr:methyl-accepting chemotaxis protein [Paraburkholderia sp. J41]
MRIFVLPALAWTNLWESTMLTSRMTVRAKLAATFGLLVAIVLLVSALGLISLSNANNSLTSFVNGVDARAWVAEQVRIAAHGRLNAMGDLGRATAPDAVEAAKTGLAAADKDVAQALRQLRLITADAADSTPRERADFATMARSEEAYHAAMADVLKAAADNRHDDVVALLAQRVRPAVKNVSGGAAAFSNASLARAKALMAQNSDNYDRQRMLLGGVCLAAVLVAMLVGTGLTRGITRALGTEPALLGRIAQRVAKGDLQPVDAAGAPPGSVLASMAQMQGSLVQLIGEVRSSGESIATGSREIAAGNLDLSARTEEQAASLGETVSAMEQLTSVVRQNTENAQQASMLARNASAVSQKGRAVVEQVVSTMNEINASSRKVAEITGMIEGIAFQTNILALNAAVEAARAGAQGRGFAVVASEVRSLAQRASAAAKEVSELIGSSVKKVDDGSELAGEAGRTMSEVTHAVARVTDIMGEIAAASSEQSRGIEHVSVAMNQMDEVTQQNAALVEQASAAAQSMQDQATGLARAVSVFQL